MKSFANFAFLLVLLAACATIAQVDEFEGDLEDATEIEDDVIVIEDDPDEDEDEDEPGSLTDEDDHIGLIPAIVSDVMSTVSSTISSSGTTNSN